MKKTLLILFLIAFAILPLRVLAEDEPPHTETAEEAGNRVFEACRPPDDCLGLASAAYDHRAREILSEGNKEERERYEEDRKNEAKKPDATPAVTTTTPAATQKGPCIEGDYSTECVGDNLEKVRQCGPAGAWIREYNQNNPGCSTSNVGKSVVGNTCLVGTADAKLCTANKDSLNGVSAFAPTGSCAGKDGAWRTACVASGSNQEDAWECIKGSWERQPRQENDACKGAKPGDSVPNASAQEGTRLKTAAAILKDGCLAVGQNVQGNADTLCGVVYGMGSSCNPTTKQCNLAIKPKDACIVSSEDPDGSGSCFKKGGGVCYNGFCSRSSVGCVPSCDPKTQACVVIDYDDQGNATEFRCVSLGHNYCQNPNSFAVTSNYVNYLGNNVAGSYCGEGKCDEATGLCKTSSTTPKTVTRCDGNRLKTYLVYPNGSTSNFIAKSCSVRYDGRDVFVPCVNDHCGTLEDIASTVTTSLPGSTPIVAKTGTLPDGTVCTRSIECSSGICQPNIDENNQPSGVRYCGGTITDKCKDKSRACNGFKVGIARICKNGAWEDESVPDAFCGSIATGATCDPDNQETIDNCEKIPGNTCLPNRTCGPRPVHTSSLSCLRANSLVCNDDVCTCAAGCKNGEVKKGESCEKLVARKPDGQSCTSPDDCESNTCAWQTINDNYGKFCGVPVGQKSIAAGQTGGQCRKEVGKAPCDIGICDRSTTTCVSETKK